jgi:hypothetical protein
VGAGGVTIGGSGAAAPSGFAVRIVVMPMLQM